MPSNKYYEQADTPKRMKNERCFKDICRAFK